MTTLDELFDPADLAAAVDAGYVTHKTHPTLPLSIYTYTRSAQYERVWTPVTTRCRGLIVDDKSGEIVAWPFPKFFNVAEHALGHDYAQPLPDGEPFTVHDKVDGSLGIVFWYDGRWRVASKGSFTSEQAQWAQAWLDSRSTGYLVPGNTYLAEIVYPANRIVVNYGQRQDLVLLAAYNADGREWKLDFVADDWIDIGTVAQTWPPMPLAELLKLTEANQLPNGQQTAGMRTEGFVIRYASGLRAKAKLAEYVRLHKVLTGITERDIWRYLGMQLFADQSPKLVAKALGCPVAEITALAGAEKGPLDALLDQVPDEFDAWVRCVAARLERDADAVETIAAHEFQRIAHLGPDRGEFAHAAQQIGDHALRSAMFLHLDGKPVRLHLWRSVKPEASAPYMADEEA